MRFDEQGNWILSGGHRSHSAICMINARQVSIIFQNLKKGWKYEDLSPLYDLTREQVSWLMVNKGKWPGVNQLTKRS